MQMEGRYMKITNYSEGFNTAYSVLDKETRNKICKNIKDLNLMKL